MPPFALPLQPCDNPLHISDIIEDTPQVEVLDVELEEEIEHYMVHLAEE